MFSPELQSKFALWRAKCADGSITMAELTEAYRLMREERKSATEAAGKRRARAKAEVKSGEDLLKELEGL